jgi:lipid A ethanolaminephosphotransferase
MNSSHFSILNPASWFSCGLEISRRLRYSANTINLIILITLVNLVLYHVPLYSFTVNNLNGLHSNSILTIITLSVIIFVVTALLISLLLQISQKLLKPISMLMFLGNSVALYYVQTYQVILDKTMMGNILNTRYSEASGFFHTNLIIYLIIFGVVPCLLLLKIRIQYTSRLRLALFSLLSVIIGLSWIYFASNTWLWFDKNSKKIGGMVLPWSYVINTLRFQTSLLSRSQEQILLPPATLSSKEKTVVILVIGESARARNFSLYGYNKPTNPWLTKSGAIALKNTVSCSTYTTASLSCMLSHNNNSSLFSEQYEPLTSYLQRYGVDVDWRTKNWGEPPMKIQSFQKSSDLEKECKDVNECDKDGVLLSGLSERIQSSKKQNVFVVLHQKGSHGPEYYTRYPSQFEKFKPVCKSVELNRCTNNELLNAYDNSILYTDYFLNRAINILKSLDNRPRMLMYISDHGESLGEHGVYLHGTPYTIAPDVQKEIPFIVWMSSEFLKKEGISLEQLKQQERHSQENVFHSILGAFDVQSDVYKQQFDIFSGVPSKK